MHPLDRVRHVKGSALATIYWHRASAWEDKEEYARAVADYTEAIRLDPKDDSAPHRLAVLYETLGKYAQAEAFHKRALALYRAGKDSHLVPPTLISLAKVSKAQGKRAQADAYFKRALAAYEADLRKHPEESTATHGLPDLYKEWGNYAKAEPLYRRLLAKQEAEAGKSDTSVASILEDLAGVYQAQRRYAEAEPLYQRALAIWEADNGKPLGNCADA